MACRSSAATAAAWGAAADVPQKFGTLSGSRSTPETKNVVFAQSGATISGLLARESDIGLPAMSKRIGVPPAEEYEFKRGGDTPNPGVLKYAAAPTACAPTAFA